MKSIFPFDTEYVGPMDFLTNQQFALVLFHAARLLREAFEDAHRDMNICWPQIRIMGRLYAQDGIGQSEVAAQLELDPMTISRQVDKLVDLGFVERRMEADDRRQRRLYLTQRSRIVRDDIETRSQGVLLQALKSLDQDQQSQLVALLTAVSMNLGSPSEYRAPENEPVMHAAAANAS